MHGKVIYGAQWDTTGLAGGTYTLVVTVSGSMPLTGTINHGSIDSSTTTSHSLTLLGGGGGGRWRRQARESRWWWPTE